MSIQTLNQTNNQEMKQVILQINDLFTQLFKMFDDEPTPNQSTKEYKNVYESIHDNDWNFATTQEVSVVRTEYFDWKPLRKYCVDNEIEIPKRHILGLELNAYPAQAWFDVYGIVLGKFDI